MSLFSILNGSSSANAQQSPLLQMLSADGTTSGMLDAVSSALGISANPSNTSASITPAAKWAAAAAADAGKNVADLTSEIRSTLDSQYAASGSKTADMTALSGRALAVVALNKDGTFSTVEAAAAKSALRERDRTSLLGLMSGQGLSSSSLAAYSNQLLAARVAMSPEERQLRDLDPSLR